MEAVGWHLKKRSIEQQTQKYIKTLSNLNTEQLELVLNAVKSGNYSQLEQIGLKELAGFLRTCDETRRRVFKLFTRAMVAVNEGKLHEVAGALIAGLRQIGIGKTDETSKATLHFMVEMTERLIDKMLSDPRVAKNLKVREKLKEFLDLLHKIKTQLKSGKLDKRLLEELRKKLNELLANLQTTLENFKLEQQQIGAPPGVQQSIQNYQDEINAVMQMWMELLREEQEERTKETGTTSKTTTKQAQTSGAKAESQKSQKRREITVADLKSMIYQKNKNPEDKRRVLSNVIPVKTRPAFA